VQHALLLVLLPVLQMLWRDIDDRGTIRIHGFVALPAGRGLVGGALRGGLGHGSLSIPCVLEELVNRWHSTLFILCQAEDSVSICRHINANKQKILYGMQCKICYTHRGASETASKHSRCMDGSCSMRNMQHKPDFAQVVNMVINLQLIMRSHLSNNACQGLSTMCQRFSDSGKAGLVDAAPQVIAGQQGVHVVQELDREASASL